MASRFSLADSSKEDSTPKFKNSWYVYVLFFIEKAGNFGYLGLFRATSTIKIFVYHLLLTLSIECLYMSGHFSGFVMTT